MDSRDINYWHSVLTDWGLYIRDGRASPGLFSTSQWPEGKPPKTRCKLARGRTRLKRLIPLPNPHETRATPQARPLTAKTETQLEVVHSAVLKLPVPHKKVLILLYLYKLNYQDACIALSLSSRQVSKLKHSAMKCIDNAAKRRIIGATA